MCGEFGGRGEGAEVPFTAKTSPFFGENALTRSAANREPRFKTSETASGMDKMIQQTCFGFHSGLHLLLVWDVSATRGTAAATPPVARHDLMIYAWPT